MNTRTNKPYSISLFLLVVLSWVAATQLSAQSENATQRKSVVQPVGDTAIPMVYVRPIVTGSYVATAVVVIDADNVVVAKYLWLRLLRERNTYRRPAPRFERLLRTTVVHATGNHMEPMTLFTLFRFNYGTRRPHLSDAVLQLREQQKAVAEGGFSALGG